MIKVIRPLISNKTIHTVAVNMTNTDNMDITVITTIMTIKILTSIITVISNRAKNVEVALL